MSAGAPITARRLAGLLAAVAVAVMLAACGSSKSDAPAGPPQPPGWTVLETKPVGLVTGEKLMYTAADGSPVWALFAIPHGPTRGCVIWENGLASTKEETIPYWQGAARIGLALFAIDLRDHGQRAGYDINVLRQAIRSPAAIKGIVTGTVSDLRQAVTYLDSRPECHHNVGYVGLSLGGIIGTILTATDPSVRVAIIMSTPATFDGVIHSVNEVPGDEILPGITKHPAELAAALKILSPLDPDRYIGRISPRPLLILAGSHDDVVLPSSARLLERAAREPKTILTYDGGHVPFDSPDVPAAVAAANVKAITEFAYQHMAGL